MDWTHFHTTEDPRDLIVPTIDVVPALRQRRRQPIVMTLCIWTMALWTAWCIKGVFIGFMTVSQSPRATTELGRSAELVGHLLGLGIWGFVWFIPTVGFGIIALVASAYRKR